MLPYYKIQYIHIESYNIDILLITKKYNIQNINQWLLKL